MQSPMSGAIPSVLCQYASGRTTGIMMDPWDGCRAQLSMKKCLSVDLWLVVFLAEKSGGDSHGARVLFDNDCAEGDCFEDFIRGCFMLDFKRCLF